jgi:thiamine kinase-like enzyme
VTLGRESGAAVLGRAELDDVLAQVPQFAGRRYRYEPIAGGLTNRLYKVSADGVPPVAVRLAGGKTALLAIDRAAESHNVAAAARAGVGPRVLTADPVNGSSVVEWIDGHTFEPAELDDERQLTRIAALCRHLHAASPFGNDFDMFVVQRGYLDVGRQHGFRLPPRYLEFEPQVARIRSALGTTRTTPVPCHNDLLAGNILDDGIRLWFIDYEYSGNNDPCFELGNIWSEATLPPDRLDQLVTAYYGYRSAAKIARARLLALMSQYGWTLWASIQDAVSTADFDFWSWGLEKYDRAVAEFDGPELARLLDDVQQPDRPPHRLTDRSRGS